MTWDWTSVSDSPCSLLWSRIRVLWRLDQRLSLFAVVVQDSCPLEVGPATLPVPCPGPGFVSSGGCMGWTSDSPCSLYWSRIRVLWRLHGTGPAIPSVHLCTDTNLEWMEYATCCVYPSSLCTLLFQWSFGVTMWEIFSGGRSPFPGVDPFTLIRFLNEGGRLDKPGNAACSHEM